MKIEYVFFLFTFKIIDAKIDLNIFTGKNHNDVKINYKGMNFKVITDEEIDLFNVHRSKLRKAVKSHLGREPDHLFYAKSLPWGKIHSDYCWEQIIVVSSVKSARVKNITSTPTILTTHDFDNDTNNTLKVSAKLSQSVQNSVSTGWTENEHIAASIAVEFGVNFYFVSTKGAAGFSYGYSWGREDEISKTMTVATSSSIEAELGPKESAVAVLSANRGELEIEVVYEASLRGNLGISFKDKFANHYYWAVPIEKIMESGQINNKIKTVGIIKMGFYTNAILKLQEKIV